MSLKERVFKWNVCVRLGDKQWRWLNRQADGTTIPAVIRALIQQAMKEK